MTSKPSTGRASPTFASTTLLEGLLSGTLEPTVAVENGRGLPASRWTSGQILERAEQFAGSFKRHGVSPGERVIFFLPTGIDVVAGLIGTWMCRAVAVIMPMDLPKLGSERYLRSVESILQTVRPRLAVGQPTLGVSCPVVQLEASWVGRSSQGAFSLEIPSADELAILQFTSGSTGKPKGVCITHGQLNANLSALARRVSSDVARRSVSWLPLYHDMGLIGGLLLPLSVGGDCYLIPTAMFSQDPSLWLSRISETGARLSPGPTFAYDLVAQRASRVRELDLSSLIFASVGAEYVPESILREVETALSPLGLPPHALRPSYGLAEATLAVTIGGPGETRRLLQVSTASANVGSRIDRVSQGLTLVGNGKPLDNIEVRIVDDGGSILSDEFVGRIQIRGDSVTSGYYGDPQREDHEWLDTGDLGFLLDGELFVSGRRKEVLIRGGVNYSPFDLELAASKARRVRRGGLAAFSLLDHRTGREKIVLVVESRVRTQQDRVELQKEIIDLVRSGAGIALDEVRIVSPGTLPKTTSGKLQRGEAKTMYQNGDL